ncbi:unnamed protein product [Orchesella dallaii]|uniref:Uncharacterized protein n=1 Tax=Orchesella dallaii TaxID=48710 RepID=A0ABP1S4M8_9HEXA
MKNLSIFLLLFLCGSVAFSRKTKKKPTTFIRETLDLDKELSILFHSCSVHIALNEIVKRTKTGYEINSYGLSPFSFPVIISNYLHVLRTIMNVEYFMKCDNSLAPLVRNQEFKFEAPPNPRMQCFVMVHIVPKSCKLWAYSPFETTDDEGYTTFRSLLIPKTFLLPMFDHRLQKKLTADNQKNGYETAVISTRPDFKVFKSGLIIVKVEMHNSDLHHTGLGYTESALFMMESIFYIKGYNAAAPTMFLFKIRFSKRMDSYIISKTMAMVCWENRMYDRAHSIYSKVKAADLSLKRVFQSFVATSTTSWQYFEALHSRCKGGINLYSRHVLGNVDKITGN